MLNVLYPPYASCPQATRGRVFCEVENTNRSVFQRDRDRIIHAASFRRLQHKAQVFILDSNDHYRTRLTHTLEVAQIARSLARGLSCNEDLAESIALAHDLGHPPFGHLGEKVLNQKMQQWGGFNHNAHSFRIITKLEHYYMKFDGLNLTWETLEGVLKHNGPLFDEKGNILQKNIVEEIKHFPPCFDFFPSSFSGIESQCAAIADDIAYNAHDIEDGLRSGFLTLEMIENVIKPFCPSLEKDVLVKFSPSCVVHEIVRYQIYTMIEDVICQSRKRLKEINPQTPDDIRNAKTLMVAFSEEMSFHEKKLKNFLQKHVYQHPVLLNLCDKAEKVISFLFDFYVAHPNEMSQSSRFSSLLEEEKDKPYQVADFLAGMTDRYALKEYERLCKDHGISIE